MGKQYRAASRVLIKTPSEKEGERGREDWYGPGQVFESDADLSEMVGIGWVTEVAPAGEQDVLKAAPKPEVKPLATGAAPVKKG